LYCNYLYCQKAANHLLAFGKGLGYQGYNGDYMRKKSLGEMVEAARSTKFSLPHEVSCKKHLLPNGKCGYVFRHSELGELGRILILPHGTQSQICCEVVGDQEDPMTEKRKSILEPITKDIAEKMTGICGEGAGKPKPYIAPTEQHVVQSMVYPCEICRAVTSMLIFAPDADTKGRLEDYARMMYSKVKELNVPSWVVGTETEFIVNGEDLRQSLVLKIHPKREEARIMIPDELMDKIDKLMNTHCQKSARKRQLQKK